MGLTYRPAHVFTADAVLLILSKAWLKAKRLTGRGTTDTNAVPGIMNHGAGPGESATRMKERRAGGDNPAREVL
jgi:hypothetical protein